MRRNDRRGVVLALVLVLGLVLSTAIYSFVRRSMVDQKIARNRDAAAQAEALARGGVQIAIALVLEDRLLEAAQEEGADNGAGPGDTRLDLWARVDEVPITTPDGGELELHIEDTGARLNLNALVDFAERNETSDQEAELFLAAFFEKVIDEIPLPEGEKLYDPDELAQHLIDFMDPDDTRIGGGGEDDYYQRQDPPYQSANRPLLSVDELRRVEGFDETLVEALRPYVTTYPLVGGAGINVNTAPPHLLASLYHGASGDRRLANEDLVRDLLQERETGRLFCDDTAIDPDRCTLVSSVGVEGTIYPPASLPSRAEVFEVTSQARVGSIRRRVEAVIDRSVPSTPRLLSWRVR